MTPMQERVESVLAAPPAGATGLLILGYPLSDVVLWLNFTYVVLLLAYTHHSCVFGRDRNSYDGMGIRVTWFPWVRDSSSFSR